MSLDVSLLENGHEVWTGNITHNLNNMAGAAGVYNAVWRPDELGLEAGDVLGHIASGIQKLLLDRERYEQHNPKNGWGDYETLVQFLIEYALALTEWPNATIEVSR